MNKWYQTIIVNHKEEEGKTTHWLDDENYKTLCKERAEQLKEIDRLHSIIKEVRDYIKSRQNTLYEIRISRILEILEKENKDGER